MITKITTNKDEYIGDRVMVTVTNKCTGYRRASITTEGHGILLDEKQWEELLTIFRMMDG